MISRSDSHLIRGAALVIVDCLVDGEYDVAVSMMQQQGLDANQLFEGVSRLGAPLAVAPQEHLDNLVFSADNAEDGEGTYTVTIPLWTDAGPTSTGLMLRVQRTPFGTYQGIALQFVELVLAESSISEERLHLESSLGPPKTHPVIPDWLRGPLEDVIHRLACGDYTSLEADGIAAAANEYGYLGVGYGIQEYGGRLIDLPAAGWDYASFESLPNEDNRWSLMVPLWTETEGPSDLCLEAIVKRTGEKVDIEIMNVQRS